MKDTERTLNELPNSELMHRANNILWEIAEKNRILLHRFDKENCHIYKEAIESVYRLNKDRMNIDHILINRWAILGASSASEASAVIRDIKEKAGFISWRDLQGIREYCLFDIEAITFTSSLKRSFFERICAQSIIPEWALKDFFSYMKLHDTAVLGGASFRGLVILAGRFMSCHELTGNPEHAAHLYLHIIFDK